MTNNEGIITTFAKSEIRSDTVLVTGGSGFVGAYCIRQLLDAGYRVRTTVRSAARERDVRAMLQNGGAEPGDRLSFIVADLASDDGWDVAVAGCRYVLHVASPFPPGAPADENDLIVPARDGALRVLRAARDAGVARVVLTSSFAAIGYDPKPEGYIYSESDWTNPTDETSAYVKSKTLAERAAWDFMAHEGGALELATICPTGIFGPVFGPDFSSSIPLIQRLLVGDNAALMPISFGVVDVRDVADLHLRAMIDPAAKGERFLAVAGRFVTLAQIAQILREQLGAEAAWVPTTFPNTSQPTRIKQATSEKARRVLGWSPRTTEEAIVATARSLIHLALV